MIVTAGAANRSIYFYIQEDAGAANPGEPVTGLVFGNLDAVSYARQGAARVAITPITLSGADAVHDDGGFILVDDTNMAGTYRLDVPDAAFVTGVDQVIVQIDPGAARVCHPIAIDLFDIDVRDNVRGGMSALPAVAAGSAGGVPTDTDANGAVRIVDGTGARELNTNAGAVALVDVVTTLTGHTPQTGDHTAGIADLPTVSEFEARTILSASYALEATLAALNDLSTADIDARLVAIGLDHLVSAAVVGADVADNSIFARLVSKEATADWDDFVNTSDSLQALRDTLALEATVAALNDISAADVWAAATRVLTANTNLNDPTAAAISTAVWEELTATARTAGTYGQLFKDNVDAVLSAIEAKLPSALVGGRMDSSVGAMAAAVITAAAHAASAVDAAALATDAVNEIRDAILSDSTPFAGANIDASIAANATPAEVLTQINAALDTAISELTQGVPTATPTLRTCGMLLYMALRNRLEVDTTGTDELTIRNNAETVIAKKLVTDDGTIYSEAEMISGP